MTDEPAEAVTGTAVEVPAEERAEAEAALARVEAEGLLPAPAEHSRSVTYHEAVELGHVLAASGYFKDATSAAQAAVKVMVGGELGFSPMAAIMGVHVIEGRPSVGGRLLGAIVKRDPHYDYVLDGPHVTRAEDGAPIDGDCTVTITLDGVALDPPSKFTWTEAQVAGLVKPSSNWIKWPGKMLFWRALSWAIDYHCPHLVGGMPLLATEDAVADVDDGRPSLVSELSPPKDRPPPLADAEAESLRKAAQAAYDDLRKLNPTLMPPARFANQVANAEHSHERLRQVVAAFEDVRDTEQAIVDAVAKLGELDPDGAAAVIDATGRMGSRAEVRDHLQAAVNALLDAEAAEGEGKAGDEPAEAEAPS